MRFVPLQAQEYTRTSQLDAITIPQAPRLGSQVVEVSGLTKAYGDRLLMKDLSFSVPPGSVVGEHVTTQCLIHNCFLRHAKELWSLYLSPQFWSPSP